MFRNSQEKTGYELDCLIVRSSTEISVSKEMLNNCMDICYVLAGGRGNRPGSDLSAEVAPRQGSSEHGILSLYVSFQNGGGNDLLQRMFAVFFPQH